MPSINRMQTAALVVLYYPMQNVGVSRAINSNSPKGIFFTASRSLVSLIEDGSSRVRRLPNSEIIAEIVLRIVTYNRHISKILGRLW